MENDTIRGSGDNTLVDVWIGGKMRAICVSRGAIEMYLGLANGQAAALSEKDRCEFVRTNLALVIGAATKRMGETGPATEMVSIDTGQLGTPGGGGPQGDRRKGRRRKSERRRALRPNDVPPAGDRRRGQRRTGERRAPPDDAGKS